MKYTCGYQVKSDENGDIIEYTIRLTGEQRLDKNDHYSRFEAADIIGILSNVQKEFDKLSTKAILAGSKKGGLEVDIDGYTGQHKFDKLSTKAILAGSKKNEFEVKLENEFKVKLDDLNLQE